MDSASKPLKYISKEMALNWKINNKINMYAAKLLLNVAKFLGKNDNNSTHYKERIASHFPYEDEFSYEEIEKEHIRNEIHDALQKVFINMDISIKCKEEERGVKNWYVIIDWTL